MKSFDEFALSEEELSKLAGGIEVVTITRDKFESGPGHFSSAKSSMTIPASKLDMWKKDHASNLGEYKISKPYDPAKGGKAVFE